MYVSISVVVDKKSYNNRVAIRFVSDLLKNTMDQVDYGAINHYWMACSFLNLGPGFEKWEKVSRPRFSEHRHIMNYDKTYTDYYGVYTCDLPTNHKVYEEFCAATEEEARRIVARLVVESLSNLDRLSKKAAAFDKARFKADVIKLFQDNDLI